jgi:hypothetical protein
LTFWQKCDTIPLIFADKGFLDMSEKIEDNYFGYVDIGDKSFACSVSGHRVTLLPAYANSKDVYGALASLDEEKGSLPKFIEGYDDQGHLIAFMCSDELGRRYIGMRTSLSFYSPLLLKAVGNASGYYAQIAENKEWTDFDAIDFCDGNLNAIYNPKQHALKQLTADEIEKIKLINDGSNTIHIKNYNDFTKSVDLIIDDIEASLTFTIRKTGDTNNFTTTSLGSIFSVIRLSFETHQPIEKFERYYSVVRDFISILTCQRNINFEVKLRQLNKDNKFFVTALCKALEQFENYSERNMTRVIPASEILTYIPELINCICNKSASALIDILPDNNKLLKVINVTNVQNLCTALEVEYEYSKEKIEKDGIIQDIKKHIKKTIKDFAKSHSEIDIHKETTIGSAFQYLDYTTKNKIYFLYENHKDAVDSLVAKWNLPSISIDRIGEFVSLRNQKTHGGTFDWGDNPDTYTPLFALAYACFLSRIGIDENMINNIVKQVL